jgi:hypothetical protein
MVFLGSICAGNEDWKPVLQNSHIHLRAFDFQTCWQQGFGQDPAISSPRSVSGQNKTKMAINKNQSDFNDKQRNCVI